MKIELKLLLSEMILKINNNLLFNNFLGDLLNETNYNNYYEQSVSNEDIAERLLEFYFIENFKNDEELDFLKEKIIKILFYLENDKKILENYKKFINNEINLFFNEFKN